MTFPTIQVVTQLPGMDDEADLVLAAKKDQADLLAAVLKASDDDADEEVIQPSVSASCCEPCCHGDSSH